MSENQAFCPNCSQEKVARFCAFCGQNHRDYRRSLPPMLYELIREAFELDGRILQSLKLLFIKPGQLSAEFSANRRASYVSPIRFYIFASILFFFCVQQFSGIDTQLPDANTEIVSEDERSVAVEAEIEYFRTLLTDVQSQKLDKLLLNEGSIPRQIAVELAKGAQASADAGNPPGDIETHVYGRAIDALDDPQTFIDRSVDNAPFAMFFLLPLYALLLKMLFVFRKKYFVEHVVYALHLHTFVFLLVTIDIVMPESIGEPIGSFLVLWFLVYYFISLRRFYGQGRLVTSVKFFVLLMSYGAILAPSILATMVLTATVL